MLGPLWLFLVSMLELWFSKLRTHKFEPRGLFLTSLNELTHAQITAVDFLDYRCNDQDGRYPYMHDNRMHIARPQAKTEMEKIGARNT